MADIVQWGGTRWWQLAGFKNLDIPLPLEILGKENLWIRIGAARNVAGSTTGYDDAPVGKVRKLPLAILLSVTINRIFFNMIVFMQLID